MCRLSLHRKFAKELTRVATQDTIAIFACCRYTIPLQNTLAEGKGIEPSSLLNDGDGFRVRLCSMHATFHMKPIIAQISLTIKAHYDIF